MSHDFNMLKNDRPLDVGTGTQLPRDGFGESFATRPVSYYCEELDETKPRMVELSAEAAARLGAPATHMTVINL